ncbi:MAG: hypothetical protein NZ651_06565 [Candidatus Bipolaricaulota bacterium]|nr:hypothetical protein [Candidatus Bipolaricaulota bacterium]MDW8127416.1 hypothetical protein [Candidatus Bipolaricaulota bacterium]
MLRVSFVLMVLSCVGFAAAAQGVPLEITYLSDPVIAQVSYRLFQAGQPPNDGQLWLWVKVQNIGKGGAGGSKLAVIVTTDVTGPKPVLLFAKQDVPPIVAEGEVEVALVPLGPWEDLRNGCCVILVVDAPVAGKPLGQLPEGAKGERNNGFVLFLAPSYDKKTLTNPAVIQDSSSLPLLWPDLIIDEVGFKIEPGSGDFRLHKFWVGIQNIGPRYADISRVAIFILSDVTGPAPASLFGTALVSGIDRDQGLKVLVSRWFSADLRECCVIAVIDAPVTGKPLGQLAEKVERNNGFAFFLTPSYELQTIPNPAFGK